MAKQSGILKLEGTIGNITFYKSQDGFLAREKGGVDGARIASDPKFQEHVKTVLNWCSRESWQSFT